MKMCVIREEPVAFVKVDAKDGNAVRSTFEFQLEGLDKEHLDSSL